jgi:hypothetical protein
MANFDDSSSSSHSSRSSTPKDPVHYNTAAAASGVGETAEPPLERPHAAKVSGFALPDEFGPTPAARRAGRANSDRSDSSEDEDPLEAEEYKLFTDDAITEREVSPTKHQRPSNRPRINADDRERAFEDAAVSDGVDADSDELTGGDYETVVDVAGLVARGRVLSASVHTSVVLTTLEGPADDEDAAADEGGASHVLLKMVNLPMSEPDAAKIMIHDMSRLQRAVASSVGDGEVDDESAIPPLLVPHRAVSIERGVATIAPYVMGGCVANLIAFGGRALHRPMMVHHRLTESEIRCVLRVLVDSVAAIHRHGFVHGNLKASNVLLSPTGLLLLTDPKDSTASPLLSADAGQLTRNMARWLRTCVRDAVDPTSSSAVSASARSTSSRDDDVARAIELLSSEVNNTSAAEYVDLQEAVFSATRAVPYQYTAADDWVAVAGIARGLALGVTRFFGMGLFDAVKATLEAEGDDEVDVTADENTVEVLEPAFLRSLNEFSQLCVAAEGPTNTDTDDHRVQALLDSELLAGLELSAAHDTVADVAEAMSRVLTHLLGSLTLPPQAQTCTVTQLRNAILAARSDDKRQPSQQQPPYLTSLYRGLLDEGIADVDEPNTLIIANGEGVSVDVFETHPSHRTGVTGIVNMRTCNIHVADRLGVVVISNISDCEISLGPCAAVMLSGVERSVVRCAGHTVIVDDSDGLTLCTVASAPILVTDRCGEHNEVCAYNVSYPGVHGDFTRVGLPLMTGKSDGHGDGAGDAFWVPAELLVASGTGHDGPWFIPRLAVHIAAPEGNVMLLPGDATQRDVVVEGGRVPSGDSPRGNERRVILLLDAMHEVMVRNFSNCIIVVVAAEQITLERLDGCIVYAVASAIMVVDCVEVQLSAQRQAGIVVATSENIDISPLMLQVPRLRSMANEVIDNAQWHDTGDDDVEVANSRNVSTYVADTLRIDLGGDEPETLSGAEQRLGSPTRRRTLAHLCTCQTTTIAGLDHPGKLLLAGANSVFPAAATADEGLSRKLVIRDVVGGVIHVGEPMGHLVLENCSGQLEVAVAAASVVEVRDCANVTLHVACGSIEVSNCKFVTLALLTQTPPNIDASCVGVQLCALNMAMDGLDEALSLIGMDPDGGGEGGSSNAFRDFRVMGATTGLQAGSVIPVAVLVPPLESLILTNDPDSNTPFLPIIQDELTDAEDERPTLSTLLHERLDDLRVSLVDRAGALLQRQPPTRTPTRESAVATPTSVRSTDPRHPAAGTAGASRRDVSAPLDADDLRRPAFDEASSANGGSLPPSAGVSPYKAEAAAVRSHVDPVAVPAGANGGSEAVTSRASSAASTPQKAAGTAVDASARGASDSRGSSVHSASAEVSPQRQQAGSPAATSPQRHADPAAGSSQHNSAASTPQKPDAAEPTVRDPALPTSAGTSPQRHVDPAPTAAVASTPSDKASAASSPQHTTSGTPSREPSQPASADVSPHKAAAVPAVAAEAQPSRAAAEAEEHYSDFDDEEIDDDVDLPGTSPDRPALIRAQPQQPAETDTAVAARDPGFDSDGSGESDNDAQAEPAAARSPHHGNASAETSPRKATTELPTASAAHDSTACTPQSRVGVSSQPASAGASPQRHIDPSADDSNATSPSRHDEPSQPASAEISPQKTATPAVTVGAGATKEERDEFSDVEEEPVEDDVTPPGTSSADAPTDHHQPAVDAVRHTDFDSDGSDRDDDDDGKGTAAPPEARRDPASRSAPSSPPKETTSGIDSRGASQPASAEVSPQKQQQQQQSQQASTSSPERRADLTSSAHSSAASTPHKTASDGSREPSQPASTEVSPQRVHSPVAEAAHTTTQPDEPHYSDVEEEQVDDDDVGLDLPGTSSSSARAPIQSQQQQPPAAGNARYAEFDSDGSGESDTEEQATAASGKPAAHSPQLQSPAKQTPSAATWSPARTADESPRRDLQHDEAMIHGSHAASKGSPDHSQPQQAASYPASDAATQDVAAHDDEPHPSSAVYNAQVDESVIDIGLDSSSDRDPDAAEATGSAIEQSPPQDVQHGLSGDHSRGVVDVSAAFSAIDHVNELSAHDLSHAAVELDASPVPHVDRTPQSRELGANDRSLSEASGARLEANSAHRSGTDSLAALSPIDNARAGSHVSSSSAALNTSSWHASPAAIAADDATASPVANRSTGSDGTSPKHHFDHDTSSDSDDDAGSKPSRLGTSHNASVQAATKTVTPAPAAPLLTSMVPPAEDDAESEGDSDDDEEHQDAAEVEKKPVSDDGRKAENSNAFASAPNPFALTTIAVFSEGGGEAEYADPFAPAPKAAISGDGGKAEDSNSFAGTTIAPLTGYGRKAGYPIPFASAPNPFAVAPKAASSGDDEGAHTDDSAGGGDELPSETQHVTAAPRGVESLDEGTDDFWNAPPSAMSKTEVLHGPRELPRSLSPLQVPRRAHRRNNATLDGSAMSNANATAAACAGRGVPVITKLEVDKVLAVVRAGPGGVVRPSRRAYDEKLEELCGEVSRKAAAIEHLLKLRNAQREL